MNSEQLLIDKWRGLNSDQQQQVLDFVEFVVQKNKPQSKEQRIKEWINWASNNPDNSPGLADEALSRDSIYNEDRSE